MDRDARWKGEFGKEICKKMGMIRSLTTAYHPQAVVNILIYSPFLLYYL